MSIRHRLLTGSMIILVFVVLVGAVGLNSLSNVNHEVESLSKYHLPSIQITDNLKSHIANFRVAELQYIYSPDAQSRMKYMGEMKSWREKIENDRQAYENLINNGKKKRQVEIYGQFILDYDQYIQIHMQVMKLGEAGKFSQALALIRGNSQQAYLAANASLDELVALNKQQVAISQRKAQRISKLAKVWLLAILVIALLSVVVTVVVMTRSITRPINRLTTAARSISGGDLTAALEQSSNDEIGLLAAAFDNMVGHLRNIITQVQEITSTIRHSSAVLSAKAVDSARITDDVNSLIHQIALEADNQSKEINSIAQMINQVSGEINDIANATQGVVMNSIKASQLTQAGQQAIEKVKNQMADIKEAVDMISAAIDDVKEHSNQIGQITAVITGIAEQTNLLALNVAIEAARAGEHGRGFAVVSEEVRKLAEESGKAAKEITMLIDSISRATDNAIIAMSAGTSKVDQGVGLTDTAFDSFRLITSEIEQTSSQIENVSASIQQLTSLSFEIAGIVDSIGKSSAQTAAITEDVASGTRTHTGMVAELTHIILSLKDTTAQLEESIRFFHT